MASLLFQLHELQDRNVECLGMLHESQEEVKLLRSKASSSACLCHPQSRGAFPVVTSTSSVAHTAVPVSSSRSTTVFAGAAARTTL